MKLTMRMKLSQVTKKLMKLLNTPLNQNLKLEMMVQMCSTL